MAQMEVQTLVLYDIPHDSTRNKVSNKCLDYGLVRFQYSAFQGSLTKNRREELVLVLHDLIEVYGGKITLVPICQTDCAGRVDLYVEPPPIEAPILNLYRED